jgi:putative transposase
MVVMDVFTRRIVGTVSNPRMSTAYASAACSTRLGTLSLFPSASAPIMTRYSGFIAGERICEFSTSRNSSPCPFVPRSHPFIERLIGTLRREYLDQTLLLERPRRVHAGLGGRTPFERCGTTACQPANLHHFTWRSDCSGLFHTPVAV